MILPRRSHVTKNYDARLATRITSSVDTRLRQLALLNRRRLCHLLDEVLDGALPTSENLAAQFARLTSRGPQPSSALTPTNTPRPAITGPAPTPAANESPEQ
jgi:hypothetical protein